MSEQRKEPMTTKERWFILGIIVIMVGMGLALFWPRDAQVVTGLQTPAPRVSLINADAIMLDLANVKCEQLLDVAIWGADGVTTTWQDGLNGCERIDGLDILIDDMVFQGWRCSLPGGIQIDWRNSQRSDCDELQFKEVK